MLKGLLMTLRLLWLVNLLTGALFYFHVGVPLNIHMYLGFAITLVMIMIGVMGLRYVFGLAVVTIVVGISLPIIGILQLKHLTMPDLPYIQITHVILGVAAIALGEITGKRIRLSPV
ncbi:hypothetical protein [Terriglobus roseus]|uniref:Uncharacterized protein n=1 Tax=Terriglobus roseus TaxID=392734 RepID=A0A1H4KAB4_9BACT|nr:hypothetical protein [Terriglobus roseus]SEB55216.1 hypothetical protein SAMN05443244_1085 [Terriglobus roseus]